MYCADRYCVRCSILFWSVSFQLLYLYVVYCSFIDRYVRFTGESRQNVQYPACQKDRSRTVEVSLSRSCFDGHNAVASIVSLLVKLCKGLFAVQYQQCDPAKRINNESGFCFALAVVVIDRKEPFFEFYDNNVHRSCLWHCSRLLRY